jgi:hypothetical protein
MTGIVRKVDVKKWTGFRNHCRIFFARFPRHVQIWDVKDVVDHGLVIPVLTEPVYTVQKASDTDDDQCDVK